MFIIEGANDDVKRQTSLVPELSIHEQEDGIIMAMCITGTSNKDSLVCWIKLLQVRLQYQRHENFYQH